MCVCNLFVPVYSHGGGGGGGGGGMSGGPPLQRHMSDFGPSRAWDSYGGGGGGSNRRYSGPREYGGSRRSEDSGYSTMTAEEWNRPLPQNERLERSERGSSLEEFLVVTLQSNRETGIVTEGLGTYID